MFNIFTRDKTQKTEDKPKDEYSEVMSQYVDQVTHLITYNLELFDISTEPNGLYAYSNKPRVSAYVYNICDFYRGSVSLGNEVIPLKSGQAAKLYTMLVEQKKKNKLKYLEDNFPLPLTVKRKKAKKNV